MDLETDLQGIAVDRALPAGLEARLTEALTSRAWDRPSEESALEGLDEPMVVPHPVSTKLQRSVATVAKEALEDVDAPRPLPPVLRARLERALMPHLRRREVATRVLSAAAAVLLFASGGVAVFRGAPGPATGGRTGADQGSFDRGAPGSEGSPAADASTLPGALTIAPPISLDGPGMDSSASGATTTAPPFAFKNIGPAQAAGARPVAVGDPMPIAVVGSGTAAAAGFGAYVDLLNENGGVDGRRWVVKEVDDAHAAARDSFATVNLGRTGATSPVGGLRVPHLEALATAETAQTGDVWSFGGAPERQARLAVAAVFPSRADGESAAIYQPVSGIFATSIADAFQDALEERGVRVFRVTVRDDAPTTHLPTDAAFLSLPAEQIDDWAAAAEAPPQRGVGAIFSAAEGSAVDDLPAGTVIASPYELEATGAESAVLRAKVGRRWGAEAIHGWVTAKALAVAMWRHGAANPSEMRDAMARLTGWDLNFTPSFGTRPGTHVRAPDALLYRVKSGAVEQVGGWRTDRS